MKYVIRRGQVVDPANQVNRVADLYIDNGRIAAIEHPPPHFHLNAPNVQAIDANGCYVLPGLIDISARLREPGEEHKATIDSETLAAAGGGITTLLCPPDTFPVIDTPAMANLVHARAQASGYAQVLPLGALTLGLAGEQLSNMAMLMQAGCAGLSNALKPVQNTLLMRRALQYAATYDAPVFMTPQDPWLLGNGSVHEGAVSTRLGLPAIPEAAETVGLARDLALIETSGARAHFDLLSCARSVEMVAEAQARGLAVSAGVSINHLLLDENAIGEFDTRSKVFPPLRTQADRQALVDGLQRGVLTTVCSDHQPHGLDAKLAPFSEAAAGISGVDSLLSLAWQLVHNSHLDLSRVVAAMTCHPAKLLGSPRGHLARGAIADVCIFNPTLNWQLDQHSMRSRGKNTPFFGHNLQGRVSHTWVNGRLVLGG